MIQNRIGLSFVDYTYEGGPLRFTVPFPYLSRDHVRVYVDDFALGSVARQEVITWIDDVTAEIPSQDGKLTAPYHVIFRRFTPIEDQLVHFRDGANLPARDLNKALRQVLFAHQELQEFAIEGSGSLPGGDPGNGDWDDIDSLVDSILQTPIMKELLERIALTDLNGETLLERILHGHALDDENRAMIQRIEQSYLDAEQAWVMADTLMLAQLDGALAAYRDEINLRVTAAETRADHVETLVVAVNDELAAFVDEQTVVINELESRTTSVETAVAANGDTFAAIEERFEAYVNGDEDTYDPPRWGATWSLKINGGSLNGQPVVAGIGLGADPVTGSTFIVMADKFAVVKPNYTTGDVAGVPFVVGTVGGVSKVGINGDLMVDGSIKATAITTNTLSAITANAGTINGGTFKTHTLDANGNVTTPLEFRAEMSNVGTWPLWVGSGVKNANNAVFWVDRSGNAKFAGNVDAPNIMGDFQRNVAVNWTGAVPFIASDYVEITRFTLPAPALVGETHTPIVSVSITHQLAGNCLYKLQRQNASIWEDVAQGGAAIISVFGTISSGNAFGSTSPAGSDSHTHSANLSVTGIIQTTADLYSQGMTLSGSSPATGSAQVFRVVAYATSAPVGPTPSVTAIRGFVMGIR